MSIISMSENPTLHGKEIQTIDTKLVPVTKNLAKCIFFTSNSSIFAPYGGSGRYSLSRKESLSLQYLQKWLSVDFQTSVIVPGTGAPSLKNKGHIRRSMYLATVKLHNGLTHKKTYK